MKDFFIDKSVDKDVSSAVSDETYIYKNVCIRNSTIKNGCSIGDESRIKDSTLSYGVEIARRNNIQFSNVGKKTCTGENTVIVASNIGKYCTISWNCSIGGGEHFIHGLSVTRASRIFNEKRTEDFYTKPLNIGNDVWIAAGAHILRGVKIGDGAVIGAGAVVKKDVPPYALVVGVPGKVVGYRFADSVIKRLLNIKWWDFSDEKLKQCKWCFYGDLDEEKISFLENVSRNNV